MAFTTFSTPHLGHLMARRVNSASASFRLHLPHLIVSNYLAFA